MTRDIIGYGGGKGGDQHVHYEATDSLHSISYARVLDLISEGEILGLANGLQSVFLDGTPVQNADGSNNFQNISIDFRAGTQTQDPIPGFPSVESETGVNIELRSTAPWVHSITNTQLDAIRVTLGVQSLSQADTTNGDINGYKIDYQIELSTDGGAYSVVLSNSFDGKTTSAYQRSARIDLPTATTGWSIRVTRLTANANTSSIADTTTIISYTEVIDAKLRYPMSAIIGIQVDAKQFSSIPTRAYDMYGRIIQVPANYDPVARTYATTGTGTSSGAWDGTFKLAWTSNPAWIFRDLVLSDRYGLGQRISASQIDKWGLYKIAQYCDAMVPNGKGGTEPRFTCNVYLQSQKEAYAVLQDLASVFRGIAYWGGGSIMTSADMPSDPVYVYTAANVIGGKFAYVGSSKKTRATVALVSWNDMSDLGRAKVEYVEDPEGIKRYGIQQINLTAFGCTSQSQAQRVGRWALATARLETEAVSFDVGLDGAIAMPGQIVRIADPSRAGRRNGGRIHSASGRDVVIDKAPTIAVGDKFTAILPTGVSETHNVFAVSGSTVTIDADWSTLPNTQSVWTVDNADLVAPLYRIISITEKDGITYSITATKHEPGKYDYVENNTVIQTYAQTSIDVTKQAAPASVTVTGYTVSLQDVQKLALHVACDPVAGAIAYEGAYKRDNGNWIPIVRQFSPSIDIMDVLPGSYTAKLSAVNSIGVASVETVSSATTVSKNSNPLNAGILLAPSAPAFHVTTAGANSPSAITFTASLLALTGTISFSCVGGTLTNITATSADLTYANLAGTSATVTASITVNGTTYSAQCSVSKVQDGANGTNGSSVFAARVYLQASSQPAAPTGGTFNFSTATLTPPTGWGASQPTSSTTPTWVALYTFSASTPGATVTAGTWATPVAVAQNGSAGGTGPRGAGHWYATGSAWSDTTADATCPGGKVVGDVVTISSSSYVMTKRWDGSAWTALATVVDGTLLVSGSVLAAALAVGSVTTEKMLISGSNLIPNPDFATGDFTNWRPFGTPANSSVIPASTAGTPTGAKSANVCKMLNGAGGQVSIFAFSSAYADTNAPRDGFAVTEGEQYNIKIDMAKTSDLSASTLAVVVYFYKSDGTHSSSILVLDLHATLTTSFATYSGSFTVPAGALRCWPYVNFVGTAGSVYWSNLRCARMADSALVVDGGIKANHLSVTSLNAITATTGALTVNDLLAISTGGALACGQTAYNTGTGYWMGLVSGTPKFSIGTPGTNSLRWDGSSLIVEGGIIDTPNLVTDAVSGVDVFSSIGNISNASSFVVSYDSRVLILASIANDPGSGAQGYSIDKFVSGTTWTANVASYSQVNANSTNLFILSAGTYRIHQASGSSTSFVTNVSILKFKK